MNIYTESSISDSAIYSLFNNNKETTTKLLKVIKSGLVLDSSYIEEQILQIKRTHISPLADKVLDAYKNQQIVLVYSKDVPNIPQAIPFINVKMGSSNRAYIFMNNYGTISDDGAVSGGHRLNTPVRDLYALMEAACIAQEYYESPALMKRNTGLMKTTMLIYTSMFMRILNKEYALSINQDLFNRVSYCISRFYLENVWEITNRDYVSNYAKMNLLNVNMTDITLTDDQYERANVKNVPELLAVLRSLSPRMKNLNMRYFTECFINQFHAPALLAMDCFPYLLFTITASMLGSFIVNQPVMSDIEKNTPGMNTFYNELSKII